MALYTSNSEFDLETRVQLTNEMPTTRDYEYLHHSLRNDTWKWLIGTEDVTYDLPVGGSESHNLEAPVKIVNGKQAENYGPNKQQVWDPTTESYVEKTPTFYKMEINGVLAAEHDLFLHEIYRYLSCLYPDHPDWLNLLTRNEILDAFNNAAAMVDYKPNNEFFRLVAETIQSDDPDVEEFKLNLRNLTSNAARRKFYGSMLGYRMYGHDAFENVSIFPVGKTLTLDSVNEDEWRENKKKSFDVKKYIIDTFDERYQTLFRRIDWLGNNRDTSFTKTNGYTIPSYSIPGYEDIQFEFVSSDTGAFTSDVYNLSKDSAYSFYDLTTNGQTSIGSISDSVELNTYEPFITETDLTYYSSDDKLIGLQTSISSPIVYNQLTKYKPFEEIIATFKENDIDGELFGVYMSQMPFNANGDVIPSNSHWFSTFISTAASFISSYGGTSKLFEKVDYSYNPVIKDTIMLPIDIMRDCYPTTVEFDEYGKVENRTAELDISSATLNKGDIISILEHTDFPTPYKVAGGTCGQLRCHITTPSKSYMQYNAITKYEPFDTSNDYITSDDNYCALIKLKDGSYGVLYGSLNLTWQISSESGHAFTCPKDITFNIRAIPEKKSEDIYKYVYGSDADNLIEETKNEIILKTRELEKHYNLVVQDCNGDSKYIDLYVGLPSKIKEQKDLIEELFKVLEELPETATPEERAAAKEAYESAVEQLDVYKDAYSTAVEKLEDVAYSNFEHYKDAESDLEDLNEELDEYLAKKSELMENRSLFVDNERCFTATRGCKVEFFIFSSSNAFSKLPYIIDDTYISEISLGNISIQPMFLSDENHIKMVTVDRFIFADYDPITLRDDKFYQLYSLMEDRARKIAFAGHNSLKIYNESEFDVSAQVYIDKSIGNACYEMQFLTDDARTKFESLSIGSKVSGPGISSNTFVTKLSNYVATVNNSLPKGGTQTYTFKCPVTTAPASIKDDPFNYKRVMYANSEYEKESFFDHGVYGTSEWPSIEKAVMNGDLNDKQILNKTSFFNVVKYLYEDKLTDDKNLLIPSVAKNTRNVFVEVNIDKIIKAKNHSGNTENLMNVEWLDYISNNDELDLAKESVNVGSNLILNADTSGYASLIPKTEYTDPNLKVLFQTNNWTDATIPAYVQIGTGGSGLRDYFKLVSNIQYPNVYGATFWDHTVEPYEDLNHKIVDDWIKEGPEGQNVNKRATWSNVDNRMSKQTDYNTYENIDKPLFEIPLNEYNINLHTIANGRKYSTIDIMFYEQNFKNISKEYNLNIGLHKTLSNKLLASDEYISIDSEDYPRNTPEDKNLKNIYYFYDDGSKTSSSKGKFKVAVNNEDFIEYGIVVGGLLGYTPWYFNKMTNKLANTPFSLNIASFPGLVNAKNNGDDITEFLRRLMIVKTIFDFSAYNATVLDEYSKNLLGYGDEEYNGFFDDLSEYEDIFKDKLIMFTYFRGNFENGENDIFGLKDFDMLALFWANDKVNFVKINKNYTLCTAVYPKNTNTNYNEYLVFHGYFTYPLIKREYVEKYDENPEEFRQIMATSDKYKMDCSNSVIEYTSQVFNSIKLPRNHIADGSYDFKLFIDPHFVSTGYRYDDYVKQGVNSATVDYCISQSAIRYDKKHEVFYTNATIVEDGVLDNSMDNDFEVMKAKLSNNQ